MKRVPWWLAAAIILTWLPVVLPLASKSAVWQWSETASSNASADPTINWREGQPPSSVNDSARAMMAALAAYRDDISGSVTTTGTSTAYSATSNQNLCASPSTTPQDGQLFSATVNNTNGASATLTVDSCASYPIQSAPGVAVPAGTMISGTPYSFKFSNANSAWMLRNLYASPYNIPLGGFLYSTISSPPNSNFAVPNGQCISNTIYSAYWTALGSPASGSCAGGQFAILDVRGRALIALDNEGGTPANRLTSSSAGCGTAFTSLGATCSNGNESSTIQTTNLPPYTPSGAVSQVAGTFAAPQGLYNISPGGIGVSLWGTTVGSPTTVSLSLSSQSFTGNAAGGSSTPMSRVNPNIGVYVYLRVL